MNKSGYDRLEGYKNGMQACGLALDEGVNAKGDFIKQSRYFAMQQLLPRESDVGFAAVDRMAIGPLRW